MTHAPVARWRLLAAVALAALALDQATKYWVAVPMDMLQVKYVVDTPIPFIQLIALYNRGISANLFYTSGETARWTFVALMCLVLAGALWAVRFVRTRGEFAAAGLALGGALGNLADRLNPAHRAVIDWIGLVGPGGGYLAVINLADLAILAGAPIFALALIRAAADRFLHKKERT